MIKFDCFAELDSVGANELIKVEKKREKNERILFLFFNFIL